jgi:hypothetical protein
MTRIPIRKSRRRQQFLLGPFEIFCLAREPKSQRQCAHPAQDLLRTSQHPGPDNKKFSRFLTEKPIGFILKFRDQPGEDWVRLRCPLESFNPLRRDKKPRMLGLEHRYNPDTNQV